MVGHKKTATPVKASRLSMRYRFSDVVSQRERGCFNAASKRAASPARLEAVVGGVRIQITDPQLAGCLLDGAGLLDQGSNGVTNDLLAFGVVSRD